MGLISRVSSRTYRIYNMFIRRFLSSSLKKLQIGKSPIQVTLENKLETTFGPNSEIYVVDQSGGCGASFQINIISEKFKGKRIIQQHKMVKSAIKEEMNEIHA